MPRVDRQAAARAIADFLRALGQEPQGELASTPEQVAAAWCDELLAGYELDAAAILREGSMPAEQAGHPLVALRAVALSTMCPHHLLPAHGDATVVYLPGARVVGLGALCRAIEARAHRLTVQERIGSEVAELLVAELGARGALCRLRMQHSCLAVRGRRQAHAVVETLAVAGSFAAAGPERELALAALASGRHGG